MVGNIEDATLALTRPSWAYMDEGSERVCYLINGVVYKVEINSRHTANAYEWDTYRHLCRQPVPRNIGIAQLNLFDVSGHRVIAAEYVEGQPVSDCVAELIGIPCDCEGTCIPSDTARAIGRLGICDLSYGNVILRDNMYVIVDMEG
jgi:hypothetical protein